MDREMKEIADRIYQQSIEIDKMAKFEILNQAEIDKLKQDILHLEELLKVKQVKSNSQT